MDDLNAWLKSDDTKLVAAIVADIARHVSALRSSGEEFYGYAVLPGDYCTQPNPATLAVAFNRESDIAPENANDAYYRYSVDEWANLVRDGFEATNSQLRTSLEQFRSAHSRAPDSFQLDEFELAFVAKTNRAILHALLELKDGGVFDNNTYLIIWYSDANYEIMNESAQALNNPIVYEQYASEFE
jgi:hypothetical protein